MLEDSLLQGGALGIVAFVVYYTLTNNNRTLEKLTIAVVELTTHLKKKNGGG